MPILLVGGDGMYKKEDAKRDFKIGFTCGLALFGALAAILILILNL